MSRRSEYIWQLVGDLLAWPMPFLLTISEPFRKDDHKVNFDSYYQPPDLEEIEKYEWCDSCEADTTHLCVRWQPAGEGTSECTECGQVNDREWLYEDD